MSMYITGDILASDADCLINTVNCEGFMGKGIAYQFKMRFPENNKAYVKACKSSALRIGTLHYFKENGKTIINFPTKDKWRAKSKMMYIEKGLDVLLNILPELNVKSIAIPPLGCGNGGLQWQEVKEVLEQKLSIAGSQYMFYIYEPSKTYKQVSRVVPKMSVSSLVLMNIKMNLKKFNSLRLQKSAYLMNLCGKQNYFKFQKHKYRPYADSIRIVSKTIKEYQDFYNLKDTKKTYQLVYQTICSDQTNRKLEELSKAIEKACNYVNNIQEDKMLEGIATVLYLLQTNENNTEENIVRMFKEWSEDKACRFSEADIKSCILYLGDTGIICKDIISNYVMTQEFNA